MSTLSVLALNMRAPNMNKSAASCSKHDKCQHGIVATAFTGISNPRRFSHYGSIRHVSPPCPRLDKCTNHARVAGFQDQANNPGR